VKNNMLFGFAIGDAGKSAPARAMQPWLQPEIAAWATPKKLLALPNKPRIKADSLAMLAATVARGRRESAPRYTSPA
jgi:hypothetical protein